MPKFIDTNQREWEIKLNVGLIEDISEQTGIDLDEMMQEKSNMSKLVFASPRKLVEILYVCCQDQITKIPLTPREFASGFNRESLDSASNAFLEALILFYPRTSAGKVLAEEFPQLLAKMDAEITRKTRESLKGAFSATATDLPES